MELDAAARLALAEDIKTKIDAYCVKSYADGHRSHLGASLIGHECPRYLWYVFRWAKAEKFDARMLRLFNRGHREEARFIEWLRGIGWEVRNGPEDDMDVGLPPNNGGEQYRVSAVMGHFGGSLDGMARPTELLHAIEDDADAFLLEFKTSGTGAGFTASRENGARRAKPKHWAQMCVYGALRKLKYAIYFIINKNDDDFHCEVVELDWNYGNELVGKAHSIIMSQEPPARLAQTPAFHVCKYCHFQGVCFRDEPMERNCRTCVHATPVEGAHWYCGKYFNTIPKDFLKTGCDVWEQIA
jgi:hypothetical protein